MTVVWTLFQRFWKVQNLIFLFFLFLGWINIDADSHNKPDLFVVFNFI